MPPTRSFTSSVRSLTRPASTCCLSTPPPQDWNRSGGSPAWVAVVSLALNASFSSGWMVNVTLLCAVLYSLAIAAHTGSIGSVFWMCHQLMVCGAFGSLDFSSPLQALSR